MATNVNGKTVMAVSYIQKKEILYGKSTLQERLLHTLIEYSKLTFDYPYPKLFLYIQKDKEWNIQ